MKQRKSSVQRGEVGGCAVMARLENRSAAAAALSCFVRRLLGGEPADWVMRDQPMQSGAVMVLFKC